MSSNQLNNISPCDVFMLIIFIGLFIYIDVIYPPFDELPNNEQIICVFFKIYQLIIISLFIFIKLLFIINDPCQILDYNIYSFIILIIFSILHIIFIVLINIKSDKYGYKSIKFYKYKYILMCMLIQFFVIFHFGLSIFLYIPV
jgi:hypothetical protein